MQALPRSRRGGCGASGTIAAALCARHQPAVRSRGGRCPPNRFPRAGRCLLARVLISYRSPSRRQCLPLSVETCWEPIGKACVYRLCRHVVVGPTLYLLGRPKIIGRHNIPRRGPVIVAANHLAVLDSFYLALAARRQVTFLAKNDYFDRSGVTGRRFNAGSSLRSAKLPDRSPRRERRVTGTGGRDQDRRARRRLGYSPGGDEITGRAAVSRTDRRGPRCPEHRSTSRSGRDHWNHARSQRAVVASSGGGRGPRSLDLTVFRSAGVDGVRSH